MKILVWKILSVPMNIFLTAFELSRLLRITACKSLALCRTHSFQLSTGSYSNAPESERAQRPPQPRWIWFPEETQRRCELYGPWTINLWKSEWRFGLDGFQELSNDSPFSFSFFILVDFFILEKVFSRSVEVVACWQKCETVACRQFNGSGCWQLTMMDEITVTWVDTIIYVALKLY